MTSSAHPSRISRINCVNRVRFVRPRRRRVRGVSRKFASPLGTLSFMGVTHKPAEKATTSLCLWSCLVDFTAFTAVSNRWFSDSACTFPLPPSRSIFTARPICEHTITSFPRYLVFYRSCLSFVFYFRVNISCGPFAFLEHRPARRTLKLMSRSLDYSLRLSQAIGPVSCVLCRVDLTICILNFVNQQIFYCTFASLDKFWCRITPGT